MALYYCHIPCCIQLGCLRRVQLLQRSPSAHCCRDWESDLGAHQLNESTKLYLNLLELEYNSDLKLNEENILNAFDKAISSTMPIETRVAFSQRKVEFLEDFGSDVKRLMVAYDDHQKLLKEHESSKRKVEDGSEEPEEKKQRSDAALASVQMMSGDLQANQSAYNYNAWYQYNYPTPWSYGQYYPPPPT